MTTTLRHTSTSHLLKLLSRVSAYPDATFHALLDELASIVREEWQGGTMLIEEFMQGIVPLGLDECRELYTRTFELNPACAPYASVHLFGEEDFKRGELMAGLAAELSRAGIDTQGELPDHISILLALLPHLPDDEQTELVGYVLLEPLRIMGQQLRGAASPYAPLPELLSLLLVTLYPEGLELCGTRSSSSVSHTSPLLPVL